MNTTRMTRLGATTAAVLLMSGAALTGPASAKDGADDNPRISDDSRNRSGGDDNPSAGEDRTRRDDNPSAGEDRRFRGDRRADRVRTRGSCSAATDWKLRARQRDGRIKVQFEVDSNRIGQRWSFVLRQGGAELASGIRTTHAPSGSFEVKRRVADVPGAQTFSAAAVNPSTGETCSASLTI